MNKLLMCTLLCLIYPITSYGASAEDTPKYYASSDRPRFDFYPIKDVIKDGYFLTTKGGTVYYSNEMSINDINEDLKKEDSDNKVILFTQSDIRKLFLAYEKFGSPDEEFTLEDGTKVPFSPFEGIKLGYLYELDEQGDPFFAEKIQAKSRFGTILPYILEGALQSFIVLLGLFLVGGIFYDLFKEKIKQFFSKRRIKPARLSQKHSKKTSTKEIEANSFEDPQVAFSFLQKATLQEKHTNQLTKKEKALLLEIQQSQEESLPDFIQEQQKPNRVKISSQKIEAEIQALAHQVKTIQATQKRALGKWRAFFKRYKLAIINSMILSIFLIPYTIINIYLYRGGGFIFVDENQDTLFIGMEEYENWFDYLDDKSVFSEKICKEEKKKRKKKRKKKFAMKRKE